MRRGHGAVEAGVQGRWQRLGALQELAVLQLLVSDQIPWLQGPQELVVLHRSVGSVAALNIHLQKPIALIHNKKLWMGDVLSLELNR